LKLGLADCFPSLVFENGQNVARRVFEPGDDGTSPAEDPSLVRFETRIVIDLKADAALRELVHRFVHIAASLETRVAAFAGKRLTVVQEGWTLENNYS
jgi:hypothetical protein